MVLYIGSNTLIHILKVLIHILIGRWKKKKNAKHNDYQLEPILNKAF